MKKFLTLSIINLNRIFYERWPQKAMPFLAAANIQPFLFLKSFLKTFLNLFLNAFRNVALPLNTSVLFCLAGANIHLISSYPILSFILFYAFILSSEEQRFIAVFFLLLMCFI
ncbi:hypothetical protein N9R06_03120 [Algibacter sp.]|nr:hypothetical protein [Algibacter sp.]